MNMRRVLMLVVSMAAAGAYAADPDVASLYEVRTDGTSSAVKAGEKGKVVIEIKAKNGAHVSDEAPLRIELSSKDSKLDKEKLTLADSLTKKAEGSAAYPDPRFEVGFTAAAPGKATVDAKMTFFICTEKVCARQTKSLSFPVVIN
ncbi:MAG: hypothetical protein IAE78_06910 [Myxococcus sp.]|nr:hypothetical protein [Myxococcus sp.]